MRLPASVTGWTWRASIERALRAAAFLMLVVALWRAIMETSGTAPELADSLALERALVRWSTVVSPDQVYTRLDSMPQPAQRDWLAALSAAGTRVSWGSGTLLPTALAVDLTADPQGGEHVRVAAPAHSTVVLSDEISVIDTAVVQSAGVLFDLGALPRAVSVTVNEQKSGVSVRDSLRLHRIAVLGRAGWEGKFVVAALEERGWKVDALLRVAPSNDVRQGSIEPIDTAHYAAVVALDTSAARYGGQIVRYVREGGGLVMTPDVARHASFAMLASGGQGELREERELSPASADPRQALALVPIVNAHGETVVLEKRDALTTVAARRVDLGRVLQIGYRDVWRWRMEGGPTAVEAHRAWWANLVSAVAYARAEPPTSDSTTTVITNGAPYATLVDRLGPQSPPVHFAALVDDTSVRWWILGGLGVVLFAEWASRRLRGAR